MDSQLLVVLAMWLLVLCLACLAHVLFEFRVHMILRVCLCSMFLSYACRNDPKYVGKSVKNYDLEAVM